MASIPGACYQAGSVHCELRRQHLCKLRSQSSLSDPTPPPSPGKSGRDSPGFFSQIFNKPISWPWGNSQVSVSAQQQTSGTSVTSVNHSVSSQSEQAVVKDR